MDNARAHGKLYFPKMFVRERTSDIVILKKLEEIEG